MTTPSPAGPPTAAPRRRRWGRLVLILALVLAAGAAGEFFAVGALAARSTLGEGRSGYAPGDPRSVVTILQAQGAALAKGDKAGWLAPVAANRPRLVEQFTQYFDALTAMKVFGWQPLVDNDQLESALAFARKGQLPAEFFVDVYFGYCWQTPTCPTAATSHLTRVGAPTEAFRANTGWTLIRGRFVLTTFLPRSVSDSEENLPWLSTPLKSAVGARVSVFADARSSVDLPAVLAQAERAAAVADSFIHWTRPARYVVYVAGGSQWESWFKGPLESSNDAVAYAIETSESSDAVVLNDRRARSLGADEVLRHEFGHVVTRLGAPRLDASGIFVEGIAEFIAHSGQPLSTYDRRTDVREYFQSGQFNGDLDSLSVRRGGVLSISAAYGAGFYLWRCIQSTYGDERMWAFVNETVRYSPELSTGPEQGAPAALGATWASVKAQCTTFIKKSY